MTMPGAEYGFKRAVSEIVGGFATSIAIKALAYSFGIPWVYILFNLFSIVAIVGLIDKMPFWSFSYLTGWFIGLIYVGPMFLSLPEFLFYIGVTILMIYLKFSNQ